MIRIYLRQMYPNLDPGHFCRWAFGPIEKDLYYQIAPAWNRLHADKLKLLPDGKPCEDIPKMVELYLNAKKSQCF